MRITKKVSERIANNLKQYTKVAEDQKARDVAEADTVTLVKDIMADCFGYDKYFELTSEQQIRGTFCDLAVKIENKIQYLVEVKAAGIDLNNSHIRQAVNYAANEGIDWVVLTNAIDWRLYRIKFAKPIDYEEVTSFNILNADPKNIDDLTSIFLLCKEGISIGAMDEFHQKAQILNKYTIANLIKSDAVVNTIRREFRRLFPDVKIDTPEIADMIVNDILKREVVDSDKAENAEKRFKKATQKLARRTAKKEAKNAVEEQQEEPIIQTH